MKKPSKPQRVPHTSDIAIVQPIGYTCSDDACHPALKASLQITVAALLAESERVEPGKMYLLRGSYTCNAPHIASLRLSAQGHTESFPVPLSDGNGDFEARAEPLAVAEGMEAVLDLLAYDAEDNLLGIRMRYTLQPRVSSDS